MKLFIVFFFPLQDKAGHWLQTKVYHFADGTGRDGDNTWFMLEPKHNLVSAIWTDNTYMDLAWDVVNNKVVFQVYITGENKVHTTVTLLNLKDLEQYTVRTFKKPLPDEDVKAIRHCNLIPFSFTRCGLKETVLQANAAVKSKRTFHVPIHFVHQTENHQFILPKRKFGSRTNNQMEGICSSIADVSVN